MPLLRLLVPRSSCCFARTLLDAGRDRLAVTLKNQPQTRAEITGILGSVYHTIGKREQALKMFEEAIQIERGNNRPTVLADLLLQASLCRLRHGRLSPSRAAG